MSLTVKLQKCYDDDRYVTKTLTDIVSVSAEMKDETSILSPVLLVSGGAATFAECNYCTIGDFGRQYFVTDIRTISNGLTEISCRCDVLSTYATYLAELDAVVERQETEYNLYLDDGSFKAYANPMVVTKEFASGFSSPCIVLGIVGG